MEALLKDLKRYFQEWLGIELKPKPWKDKESLPFFLQDFYDFYIVSLLDKLCIFVIDREIDTFTPAEVRKHFEQIQKKTEIPCIFISASASSYNRKRLMKHRIQFVIPGRQIYLPALGIDWLDSCKICRKHRIVPKTISPSTQAIMIYVLLHQRATEFISLELAKVLNYTPMTMTRARNELELCELVKTFQKGRERRFIFTEDRALLWKQVEPFMQNPVKKSLWVKLKKNGIKEIKRLGALAGLSALADQSMLSSPVHPVYAVSWQSWKILQQSGHIQELPSAEEADIELEVWNYDPMLFAKNGIIDLFSLYMSLRENQDERVELSLNKVMKGIKW